MKYTRYDLKKKKDSKTFILLIFLILVLAFLFATIIFQVFTTDYNSGKDSKNEMSTVQNTSNQKNQKNTIGKENSQEIKFIVVQGGIYQNKDNVETEKNLLNPYGTPFTVTEDNKTRVLLGIYAEDQGEKIVKSLNDQKVDNSKMVFTINKTDVCDAEIAELVSADIQILNKLSEKDVKAIQTADLKKWCLTLKNVSNSSKNADVLNQFKNYVNKMPKEISKDKAGENYSYLYEVLKKVGSKK
ncbi:hypothetical protein HBE96_18130 [Clostridium sp. P21]|uniref:Transmembrane protein n=1 Tax=Clostridium muellerianum TaxID=2716538 RepID=A0A7Y0EJA8_9CLOT|nr:hypothetical protein [Clostridium muellerianum]NMM64528.1 hypothetical protein [Clostridium muellerianum]